MMRSIAAMAFALALLCMTSCNDTQQVSSHAESTNTSPKELSSTASERPVHGDVASRSRVSGDHGMLHESSQHRESAENHRSSTTANAHHHGHDSHLAVHEDAGREARDGSDSNTIAVGDNVPDLEVVIDGATWKLSELQKNSAFGEDGTVVLTFWCSFCHSCRHVEKDLDQLARQYRRRVAVIALDASAGETAEEVAEFAAKRELTFPIALDAAGVSADVFGTRVTTTTVVIDKAGVLRYRGQFSDGQHRFARDALRAVLAGQEVPVDETPQKG